MTKREVLMEQVVQLGYTWDQWATDMELKDCKLSMPTIREFMAGKHPSVKTWMKFNKYCKTLDQIAIESAEEDLI